MRYEIKTFLVVLKLFFHVERHLNPYWNYLHCFGDAKCFLYPRKDYNQAQKHWNYITYVNCLIYMSLRFDA